jgi:hypothetical protein
MAGGDIAVTTGLDRGPNASIGAQRFMVWTTIGLCVLFGIAVMGLMRFLPAVPANLSADQVVPLYAEHNIRFRIGVLLALISGGFIIPLTLVISVQMARLERGVPVWALLQGVTGVLGSILIWLPILIWGAAAFSPERPPELIRMFHELGWLMFIATLSLFPMQLIGIIYVAFTKDEDDAVSAFPRWLGYLTAWQLVQSFGGPIAILFKSGIFAWDGLLPFWLPFILFFAWLVAVCWTILRALRAQEAAR